jgi:hypothetical protein
MPRARRARRADAAQVSMAGRDNQFRTIRCNRGPSKSGEIRTGIQPAPCCLAVHNARA